MTMLKRNPMPYIVGCHFSDGNTAMTWVGFQAGYSEVDAATRAVSNYYIGGGVPLPLLGVHAQLVDEAAARAALNLIEADQAAQKAEAEKVRPFGVVLGDDPPAAPADVAQAEPYPSTAQFPHEPSRDFACLCRSLPHLHWCPQYQPPGAA